MHRIEGPYIGLDAQGNPIFKETPLPPTAVPADWLNAIQEEIATLIEYTGLELQTAGTDTWDQLKKSIFNRSPLYTTDLAEALFIRFQNSATEYTSTDGTRFGIDAAGNTEIWNYENTELQIGTNNQDRFKIKTDGTFDFLDGVNTVNLDLSATANVDIGADLAVTADCTIDQDLATTEDVQFERIKLYENAAQTTSVQCQNSISGSAFNDGIYFGMHATGVGHIWNYGNTDILVATNGLERLRIKNTGETVIKYKEIQYGCRAKLSANFNILTVNSGKIPLNAEDWDFNNEFNTSTYRYTATIAGHYLVVGHMAAFFNSATQEGELAIRKNGNEIANTHILNDPQTDTGLSTIVYLGIGDYIELHYYLLNDNSVIDAVRTALCISYLN